MATVGRKFATVREGLVGTVGGGGAFSATRVASPTRHVAIAYAKGIAKTNTYLLAELRVLTYVPTTCLLACPPP